MLSKNRSNKGRWVLPGYRNKWVHLGGKFFKAFCLSSRTLPEKHARENPVLIFAHHDENGPPGKLWGMFGPKYCRYKIENFCFFWTQTTKKQKIEMGSWSNSWGIPWISVAVASAESPWAPCSNFFIGFIWVPTLISTRRGPLERIHILCSWKPWLPILLGCPKWILMGCFHHCVHDVAPNYYWNQQNADIWGSQSDSNIWSSEIILQNFSHLQPQCLNTHLLNHNVLISFEHRWNWLANLNDYRPWFVNLWYVYYNKCNWCFRTRATTCVEISLACAAWNFSWFLLVISDLFLALQSRMNHAQPFRTSGSEF